MEQPQFFSKENELPAAATKKDVVLSSYRELFFIDNPTLSKHDPTHSPTADSFAQSKASANTWVFYPWLSVAVCIPEESAYFRIRTARNEIIITKEEQQRYRDAHVAIAGLSVGSAALATIVATGGPKHLRIADPDIIEISNLNRMRANLADVQVNKAVAAALHAWEIDPFAEIEVWEQGATPMNEFVAQMDVVVDEMDSIDAKFLLRNECRAAKIPVLMATDNGEGAILDVERFDIEPERPIFHGRVSVDGRVLTGLSRQEFAKIASEIIDPNLFTPRQRESVGLVGTKVAGIAQLATAASVAGAAVAYATRLITTGGALPSGRYVISPENAIAS